MTRDGVTTGYSRFISGSGGSMTVTDAESSDAVYLLNLTRGESPTVFDPLERSTTYSYDSNGRLAGEQRGRKATASAIPTTRAATSPRSQAARNRLGPADDIVTSASYPSSCPTRSPATSRTAPPTRAATSPNTPTIRTHGGVTDGDRAGAGSGGAPAADALQLHAGHRGDRPAGLSADRDLGLPDPAGASAARPRLRRQRRRGPRP